MAKKKKEQTDEFGTAIDADDAISEQEIEEAPVYLISAADPRSIEELLALRLCSRANDPEWAGKIEKVIRDFELYERK